MRLIAEGLGGNRAGEPVFSGVAFAVAKGGSLVVTGPNGSGKSTLLKIVAGLLPAATGTVRLEGFAADAAIASLCHYLGHENAMKTVLTVAENLAFWRRFLGGPHRCVEDALDAVGLGEIGHLPFAYLSAGQRRRVAIARLLVSRRPIWLLDEPTVGLDAASEARFSALMQDHLRDGGMLIAATHQPLALAGASELAMGDD